MDPRSITALGRPAGAAAVVAAAAAAAAECQQGRGCQWEWSGCCGGAASAAAADGAAVVWGEGCDQSNALTRAAHVQTVHLGAIMGVYQVDARFEAVILCRAFSWPAVSVDFFPMHALIKVIRCVIKSSVMCT
jgi:hypothetical protein